MFSDSTNYKINKKCQKDTNDENKKTKLSNTVDRRHIYMKPKNRNIGQ